MKTKQTILACCIAAALVSCQPTVECPEVVTGTAINPNWKADIQLVRDYTDKLINNDLDGARALMADSFKGYGPGTKDSTDLEKELEEWRITNETYSDMKLDYVAYSQQVTPDNPVKGIVGTWVQLWGTYSGQHKSGQKISFPFHANYRVDSGKVVNSYVYYDRLAVYEDFGYTLVPPVPADEDAVAMEE